MFLITLDPAFKVINCNKQSFFSLAESVKCPCLNSEAWSNTGALTSYCSSGCASSEAVLPRWFCLTELSWSLPSLWSNGWWAFLQSSREHSRSLVQYILRCPRRRHDQHALCSFVNSIRSTGFLSMNTLQLRISCWELVCIQHGIWSSSLALGGLLPVDIAGDSFFSFIFWTWFNFSGPLVCLDDLKSLDPYSAARLCFSKNSSRNGNLFLSSIVESLSLISKHHNDLTLGGSFSSIKLTIVEFEISDSMLMRERSR